MARILAYCDSPTAPTGFGRSAKHVLEALHKAGHEIVQLAVNHDPRTNRQIPWRAYSPANPGLQNDPYGVADIPRILQNEQPFDLLWTTFDPECPWAINVPGIQPQMTVLGLLSSIRKTNPGFRMLGWFPVDGGPLSDFEMAVLGSPHAFDVCVTMSPHVRELVRWSGKLKGNDIDPKYVEQRVEVVPHGIEMDRYRISSDEARRAAKQRLGFDPDCFLVVQVERNQPRKQPFNGLALIEKIRQTKPALEREVRLWQHMVDDEETKGCGVGFRMRELAWRYGLKADHDVRWPDRMFSEEEMSDTVYAAADVVFSGSAGEGFQYPLWEALACGRRVVAPNSDARKAWLSETPGAHLYEVSENTNVIRGSYNRRMSTPNIQSAAAIVRKMIDGRKGEMPEASREWVGRTASVDKVQAWWVDRVAKELAVLADERRQNRAAIREPHDVVIDMRANHGLGDLIMAGPAIRAFQAANEGKTVCLALPPTPFHRTLADWMQLADTVQTQPSIPLEELGGEVISVSRLWHPIEQADPGWMGLRHRTDVVAEALGLPDDTAFDTNFPCPDKLATMATNQFSTRFDVDLHECVVIACESAQRNRSLPEAYVNSLAGLIRRGGRVPILVGRRPIDNQTVGVVNLTGQTDLVALMGIVGGCKAVVAIDSFPMHLAAAMGKPTVALCPVHPAKARLLHYDRSRVVPLEPEQTELAGEHWPPGEYGSPLWTESIRPTRIARALSDLLGDTVAEA